MITTLLLILTGATLVYFYYLIRAIKSIEPEKNKLDEKSVSYTQEELFSIIKAHENRFDKIEESISVLLLNNILALKNKSLGVKNPNYQWQLYTDFAQIDTDLELGGEFDWQKIIEEQKVVEEEVEVTPSYDNRSSYQLNYNI